MKYVQHLGDVPQSEPLTPEQVKNRAGGYAWAVDEWTRLDRFLVLGCEGGTYYAGERDLLKENLTNIALLANRDGVRVVERVVEISEGGRAPKNDPALLVLAICSKSADAATRRAAYEALPRVARTPYHLFLFLEYRHRLGGGWGRGLKWAVRNWYARKDPDQLAYHLVKYRQRQGWTHRDVFRLAHVRLSGVADDLVGWVVGEYKGTSIHPLALGFKMAQEAESDEDAARLIRQFSLPWEALKPEHLTSPVVWEALLDQGMPMTALLRNLATMTRVGLIKPHSDAAARVADQIVDRERLRKARVHPIALLAASTTYGSGRSARGGTTWTPVSEIVEALDEAFELAFDNVEPTGKRVLYAIDVSTSMSWGEVAGIPDLTPRLASAALALVSARTEKRAEFLAFSHELVPVTISRRRTSVRHLARDLAAIPMGGTDCALPMLWALENGVSVDAFVVYTDNETWAGRVHPADALRKYRRTMGIPAKLVVVAMTSDNFSIADPNDAGMLDVVGFDTATPALINDFIRGEGN